MKEMKGGRGRFNKVTIAHIKTKSGDIESMLLLIKILRDEE
jgi:hypothetical protein